MEGLDIDEESDEMSLSRAQEIIREQTDRIRQLEDVEEAYHRLQKEFDRLKSDLTSQQQQENPQNDTLMAELRAAKETIREKDRRLQYLEEANNRFVFRMRNLQVEISGKDNEIRELNQEITFMKRKLDKPMEILINEIKQKDLIIESYKRKQRQNRTMSIRIEDVDIEHMSASSMGSVPSSYVGSMSQQNSWYHGRRRYIRQNRVSVQDETEIVNEWNKTLQIFGDHCDPSFVLHLKQYVLLSISRLAMLAKDVDSTDEGIFSQCCYLCSKPFSCLHKSHVCFYCGYLFCHQCSPRTLPLGLKNEEKTICVLCEAMYRFVYKKDDN